jgi:hypothetical protein
MESLINGAKKQFNLNTIILGICGFLAVRAINQMDNQIALITRQHDSVVVRLTRIETLLKMVQPQPDAALIDPVLVPQKH